MAVRRLNRKQRCFRLGGRFESFFSGPGNGAYGLNKGRASSLSVRHPYCLRGPPLSAKARLFPRHEADPGAEH